MNKNQTFAYLCLSISSISIVTAPTWAGETCSTPSSAEAIVDCALSHHPKIRSSEVSVEQGVALDEIARMRPNPEFNSSGAYAPSTQTGGTMLEINLAHTFELGGKRGARIQKAEAEQERIRADLLNSKEEILRNTVITLYRLSHIQTEIHDLDEALNHFKSVEAQYRSRPRLGPEEQATLHVIEIAEGDYQLRKLPLIEQTERLERFLSIALGLPPEKTIHLDAQLLPPKKEKWPTLVKATPSLSGAELRGAWANLKLADASKELADSAAWPDMKFGPSYQLQSQYQSLFSGFGLNLTFGMPLYHRNEGGKAYALRQQEKSEIELNQAKAETLLEYNHLHGVYERAVQNLKESFSQSELGKKQTALENLFKRGLVSGSLIIETHRQLIEYTISKNNRELDALRALMRLLELEGKLIEERNVLFK
jgi:cobalt-zinc-cadmium efflux system outer membrane protein